MEDSDDILLDGDDLAQLEAVETTFLLARAEPDEPSLQNHRKAPNYVDVRVEASDLTDEGLLRAIVSHIEAGGENSEWLHEALLSLENDNEANLMKAGSLFERFRCRTGRLSVSDLCSPCNEPR